MATSSRFFDWEHSANGPTEAINGRLETLRGIALGFRKPRQLHHQKPAARRRLQTRHPNPPLTHAPTRQNRKSPITCYTTRMPPIPHSGRISRIDVLTGFYGRHRFFTNERMTAIKPRLMAPDSTANTCGRRNSLRMLMAPVTQWSSNQTRTSLLEYRPTRSPQVSMRVT